MVSVEDKAQNETLGTLQNELYPGPAIPFSALPVEGRLWPFFNDDDGGDDMSYHH